jgi:hypothetical protein
MSIEESQVRVHWWFNYSGLQGRHKRRVKQKHYFCNRNLRTREISSEVKTGLIGCPKTSVRNCHHSLRNNSQERSYDLFHGARLRKFRVVEAL